MSRFLRLCRTIHSWMGVILLPWVIVIGATGFYLNHRDMVLSWIGQVEFSEQAFDAQKLQAQKTLDDARRLGETIWPAQPIKRIFREDYHGRESFHVRKNSGTIILSIPTGHYYVKTVTSRKTYSPDGQLLHFKRYWGRVFKQLHETGWLGGGMGTWLADIVGLCMILFGSTGLILWATPRLRRLTSRSRRSPPARTGQFSKV